MVLNVIDGSVPRSLSFPFFFPLLSPSSLSSLLSSSSLTPFSHPLLSPPTLTSFSHPLLFPPLLSPHYLFSPFLSHLLSPLFFLPLLSHLSSVLLFPLPFSLSLYLFPLFSLPMSLPPLLSILTPPSSLLSNFFFSFMLLNEIHLFYDGIC